MTKDQFFITGLGGKKTLKGELTVGGAKNAILPLLAATTLLSDSVTFENVPAIDDVRRMVELLTKLGMHVDSKLSHNTLVVSSEGISNAILDHEISKRLRASVILTGPLLSRFGEVHFPHPGGCVIGARPIDIFLDGFKKMGADVREGDKGYSIVASKGKLSGAEIFFKLQSVTGTETFIMAGVLAEGKTVLKNCALEPEIQDLIDFLVLAGANIKGRGTTTIEIVGGGLLSGKGLVHKTLPDRIEAGSFLILGALCADSLLIKNCHPEDLGVVIALLRDSGVPIETGKDFIKIEGNGGRANSSFKSFNIRTHEFPGFPTDLQAPMTVFLTQAEGEALVFETIFEGRLNYTADLLRMGADIKLWDAHRAVVKGPADLKGKEVEGPDIRAGLAFIIAALIAKGESVINNVYYVDRGYERIEERLRSIGAKIERRT